MADAGLDADVVLDITAALRAVDKLEEALARATSNVVVTADARAVTAAVDAALANADSSVQILAEADQLTSEITAAVEAADSQVVVTGDATELTGDVTGAIEAADTQVIVTGDASELTGEVTAAVDAGDSQVTVTADTGEARSEIVQLGAAADEAAGGASRLGVALAGIGALGVAKALFDTAAAASDLAESTSKATAVFGPFTDDIVTFSQEAAQALGLSEQAALEAAGTFGNLFQALGTSQEVAAELSPQILTLAADLASFNNLGIEETLEKLRSGLVGEIEPLRSIGISFNAAQVEARAFELGLQDASGALTEGAKLQARYSLIVEQSAIANGDFSRTSEGLANQQRILTAEFQNAVAAAGQQLLPALLTLVDLARRELIPGFAELAENVLPALAEAFVALAPLLGTSLDILIALSPIIAVVGEVLASIPTPLLEGAAALLLFNKAFGGLSGLLAGTTGTLKILPQLLNGTAQALPRAASGAGALSGGIAKIATGIAGLNPLVLAAGVGAGILFQRYQEGKQRAADVDAAVEKLRGTLAGVGTEFATTEQAVASFLTKMVEADTKIESTNRFLDSGFTAGEAFRTLGIDAQIAADLIAGGTPAILEFADGLGELDDEQKIAIALLGELEQQTAKAAEAQLKALSATGKLTQEEEARLTALDNVGAGTARYAALLEDSTGRIADQALATEVANEKYGPLIEQITAAGDAMESLGSSAPLLAAGLEAVSSGVVSTERGFFDLAVSIGEAELSEEQMAEAALVLGTDLETLTAITEQAAEALDEFVSTATGNLPELADAFGNVGDDSVLSVNEFVSALEESAESIATFRSNLAALAEAGFSDIAGIIAEQGPEVGGALAAELVAALETGNVEVLEKVREATTGFNDEWTTTAAFFRDVIGPEFILSSGLLGAGITEAFGSELSFSERMRIAAELAQSTLTVEGQAIAAIAATEGEQAARDYGTALNLDEQTVEQAVAAGLALGRQPTTAASNAGKRQGEAFADGFGEGISNRAGAAADKAAQLAVRAEQAAREELQATSPSRLLAELGADFGDGFALGIQNSVAQVAAEADAMVTAAVDAITGAPDAELTIVPAVLDPETVALASLDASAAAGALAGGAGDVTLTVAPGAVVVSFTGPVSDREARRVGAAVLDGIVDAAAQRQIAIDLRASAGANG